jgi:hypothetical protein
LLDDDARSFLLAMALVSTAGRRAVSRWWHNPSDGRNHDHIEKIFVEVHVLDLRGDEIRRDALSDS